MPGWRRSPREACACCVAQCPLVVLQDLCRAASLPCRSRLGVRASRGFRRRRGSGLRGLTRRSRRRPGRPVCSLSTPHGARTGFHRAACSSLGARPARARCPCIAWSRECTPMAGQATLSSRPPKHGARHRRRAYRRLAAPDDRRSGPGRARLLERFLVAPGRHRSRPQLLDGQTYVTDPADNWVGAARMGGARRG